eukprot:8913249-Pyramimonas_sp.AAC.1
MFSLPFCDWCVRLLFAYRSNTRVSSAVADFSHVVLGLGGASSYEAADRPSKYQTQAPIT